MDVKQQAKQIVAKMSLEEKAACCSGYDFWHLKANERLGLEQIMVTDGPHGLRKQAAGTDHLGLNASVPATCFPAASATACSFDRELLNEIGAAMGEECRQEEVAVVLGPGVNIKRSPLCGRNFEYFSEDPLLAGELGAAFVEGVQSQNVGTSLKHFAANNQEKLRMTSESVVDERTLRELYLPAFERIIKGAKPWTVMCSYNRLYGGFVSESKWLLTDVLRKEWGYGGLVVSDWGAVNDRVAGVRAGMDLEMPATSRENDEAVAAAVKSGELKESELDACAERVVELILKSKQRQPYKYDVEAHHALARRAAAHSAVLLKNERGLLPLKAGQSVAIIGAMAEKPRYQGAGSSKINPHRVDSAVEELKKAGFDAAYAAGYDTTRDAPDEALISEACAAAKGKDVVLIFAGLPDRYESEGFDRKSIAMPESHVKLIERVGAVNPNTVVVLQCGAVVDCAWEASAGAILLAYLGGEATCGGVADVLTGKVNPSGKLAESWCIRLEDNPSYADFARDARTVEYRESVYVGYRYYDTANVPVRYPFGYGLSYTTFEYGGLELDKSVMSDAETLRVSVEIKNVGERDGAEAVQLYIAPKVNGVFRPAQELKGFELVKLAAGESRRVSFELDRRAFAYYNTDVADWAVESGEYEVRVGASSRDIRCAATVTVSAQKPAVAPDYRAIVPSLYDLSQGIRVPDDQFTALYGKPLPPRKMAEGEKHTINSTTGEIQNRWFGRKLAGILHKKATEMLGDDPDVKLMMENMMNDAPLRMLLMAGGDTMTHKRLNGLVELVNGRLFKGLGLLLKK